MNQEQFDTDYKRLRRMLLRGQVNLEEARIWLKEKHEEVRDGLADELLGSLAKWGANADRDIKHLNEILEDD